MALLTEEQRNFLLQGTRTGKLATVRKDGRPHVVPIWFTLDGDTLVFNTGDKSIKAINIRHNARVSLCVDDENPPYAFIQVEGTATLEQNSESLQLWATRIAERYMGHELAEAYGVRNSTPDELVVRITPIKVIFNPSVSG